MTEHDHNTPPPMPFNFEMWATGIVDRVTRIVYEGRNEQSKELAANKDWLEMRLDAQDRAISEVREEMRVLAQSIKEKMDIGFEINYAQSVKKEGLIRDLIDQHQLLTTRIIQAAQAGKVPDKDVIDQYTHIGQQIITQTQVSA